MLAGFMSGIRQVSSAARLGSAIVSAVPGDSLTFGLAAQHLGIAPTAVLSRFLKEAIGDKTHGKELATPMGLSSADIRDSALAHSRYSDEFARGLPARISESLYRVSGLTGWTEGMKRVSSMEIMGLVARQSDYAFDKVDPEFATFLKRYGFAADNWDILRSAPQIEAEGARFWDAQNLIALWVKA